MPLDPEGLRAGAAFGTSVAISGNLAVVGGPFQAGGLAYVYAPKSGGWRQTAELRGEDTRPGDFFGGAIAVKGRTIVVGADVHDGATGRAYVFTEESGSWRQIAELKNTGPGRASGFGLSVAEGAGTIVVGSAGAAVVFTRDRRGWRQAAQLHLQGASTDTSFGFSVAASGPLVVVGDPGAAGGAGRAYVFGTTRHGWRQLAELAGLDTKLGDNFGFSVAAGAGRVLVGAPWHGAGAAYVFSPAHQRWHQVAEITGPDSRAGDQFGSSVALDAGLAVVGAPSHRAGAAYVFSPSREAWHEIAEITPPGASRSDFGIAEAVSGATVVTGANAYHNGTGAAWVTNAISGHVA